MVIRGSDQRRRRVVLDEVKHQHDSQKTVARKSNSKTTKKPKSKSKPEPSRDYAFAAERRNQRKTTDLIPKRFFSVSVLLLGLVASIGILNLLAAFAPGWKSVIGTDGVRAFSISGAGSLSSWFSSFLLIITGMASLQIYAIRQHRCDDYRGTYRLWLWMALLMLLASVHCVIDLGIVLGNLTQAITQQSISDKVWALVTFKMVAMTMLVVRGLFEVRESRGTLAMVVLVWVAYSAATVLQIPAVKNSLVVDFDTVYGNVILIATTALFLSMTTYARFIYLHANGLIKLKPKAVKETPDSTAQKSEAKKTKPKAKAKTKAPAKSKKKAAAKKSKEPNVDQQASTQKKVRSAVPKPAKAAKTRPPVPKPSQKPAAKTESVASEESEISDVLKITPEQYAKMSKSERRRHRKLEKRARRAA